MLFWTAAAGPRLRRGLLPWLLPAMRELVPAVTGSQSSAGRHSPGFLVNSQGGSRRDRPPGPTPKSPEWSRKSEAGFP
jgi:hypothetical protein